MKTIVFLLLLAVLSVGVVADMCSDTEDGPDRPSSPDDETLSTKGTVRYGLQDKEDVCIISESSEVSTASSSYLKEYYCDDDDLEYEIYDCTDFGFTGCEFGECVGKDVPSSNSSNASNTTSSVDPGPVCGDHMTEGDEECDPPHSICFGADMSEYGQCTDDCKCKLANAVATKCGNGVIDDGETCEDDYDCDSWEMCKKCICVDKPQQNTTVSDDNTTDTNTTDTVSTQVNDTVSTTPVDPDKIAEEIDSKYPNPEIHPVEDVEGKNFTDDPAIKTTGGIARFFTNIWKWFVSLFS